MGIGKSNQIAGALIGAVAMLLLCAQAGEAFERKSGIWKVLRAGHFSGPMNEGAHVRPVKGAIAANGTRYKFWEYSWLNKETGHGGTGLLVFELGAHGLSYLGSYDVALDDFRGPVHPEVRGKTLFFPFRDIEILGDKRSFAISFEHGPPLEMFPGSVIKFGR
jgi:hypothetical protein